MSLNKDGIVVILSSPSGAGKTTLVKKIAKENSYNISISHTTRKPRTEEIDGQDYFFVDQHKFNQLVKENKFFEHAKIFNNYYGTLKEPVLKIISSGKDVLFDIDWQGTQQLKKNKDLKLVTFFIIPPNIQLLKERLLNRHENQESLVEQRMKKFNEEISHWNEYNYVVVNDDLESCYNKILDIMLKEKKGESIEQNLEEIRKRVEKLTN